MENLELLNRIARLESFMEEYYRNNNPTSTVFTKKCYFPGGIDISQGVIAVGGTSSTIGLYGATPVARAAAIAAPSAPSAAYAQAEAQSAVNAINSIRVALQNIGVTS